MNTTPLPLVIVAKGEIVESNFDAFAVAVRARLTEFNTNLRTDEDFEQAATDAKVIAAAESEFKAAKESALAQAEALNTLFSQIDDLTGELAKARLSMTKQIKDRREEIQAEIVKSALAKLRCDASMRSGYASTLAAALKGKRTLETMRDAVRGAMDAINDQILRSRELLDEFIAANGRELVMDYRTLETTDPAQVSAELRRRIEARDAEREKAKLREAAETARREAQEARREVERVKAPQATAEAPQATTEGGAQMSGPLPVSVESTGKTAGAQPDPVTVTDLPWDGARPTVTDQNEADELSEFLALVVAQCGPIREARLLLRFEPNRMAAGALANALNGWFQSTKKGLGK